MTRYYVQVTQKYYCKSRNSSRQLNLDVDRCKLTVICQKLKKVPNIHVSL